MRFWRWLFYRELTQTEARERMKQALPEHAPIPPTWRVHKQQPVISVWQQRADRILRRTA